MPAPITSKVTTKAQTTIPRRVRERLGLQPGDHLLYEICDDRAGEVRLRRLAPADAAYLRAVQATLGEWDSPEDEAAYAGL
jgi:AbrB family looped-hinge helix DNA binding protein